MMRLQKYDVTVSYERGKNMFLADLLSRAYLPKGPEQEDKEFEFVNMASCVPISDPRLEEIRQVLMKVILQGWSEDKSSVPSLALPYFNQRDELTVQNVLIFRGERVVVPKRLREVTKHKIHSSRYGRTATPSAPTTAETSAILQQDRRRSAEVSDRRRGSYETVKEPRAQMAQGDSNTEGG